MRTRFDGPSGDQLYLRLDPLAGGTGGGGAENTGANTANLAAVSGRPVPVASNPNTSTNAINRNYAVPTYEALESSQGFSRASVGYAGTASDGLTMLDAAHALTPYASAPNGHVALTAGVRLDQRHSVELALGFGTTEANALAVAGDSLGQSFGGARASYESQWLRYDAKLRRPSWSLGAAAVGEYYQSVNVVKASEDKTFPGAIAAEIAGLTAAAHIASVNGDSLRAAVYQATADDFARDVKGWTVTTTGPDGPRYFIRLSKTGDPNAAISYNLGNGGPTLDQRSVIDAGFLELVRLGVLPASDPDILASVGVVDKQIEVITPSGPGYYRYGNNAANGSADGYGDCYQPSQTSCPLTGAPWPPTGTGTGHLWPVLSGEHAEYDLAGGNAAGAQALLSSTRNMTSGQGLAPEQAWEDRTVPPSPYGSDPTTASIGFQDSQAAGSASPLTWAQAQYARLALNLSAGRNLETPDIVTDRYVTHGMPGALPLTVTSPANGSSVDTATVTVSGTTSPGATVNAEAVGLAGGTAATASTTAGPDGSWSLPVPSPFGSTTITVTAGSSAGTGYAQVAVTNDGALPGTNVLNVTDPSRDDNGPGTYQYPTASDFHQGAFDLTGMQVNQTATAMYLRVEIANLASTFGSPFGAQLLDVYVHNPAAKSTSTQAAYPSRNYTIAVAGAWSERVEAQGFATPGLVDASGTTLASGQLVVNQTAGTATTRRGPTPSACVPPAVRPRSAPSIPPRCPR